MIYLASQSPRRQELLTQLGVEFDIVDVCVHEQRQKDESPLDYVSRVAREKAGLGLLQLQGNSQAIVLGADTDVILHDLVFGKPENDEQAIQMLKQLSGTTHEVITAVWLVSAEREVHHVVSSKVRFATLRNQDILNYIATGESFGKAGAYAIQGKAAAFIETIEGSYSGIMGLPLHETFQLLQEFNVPVWAK
ncbi:MAG: Maf family protein [Shewanella sp.]